MNSKSSLITTIPLLFAAFQTSAVAAMVNLAVSQDTFLIETFADNNAGAHTHVSSGTSGTGSDRRGLLRFDFSSIPAGSTINSVTLTSAVIGTPGGGGTNSTFNLHRSLAAWNEGIQTGNNGALAANGEATWNNSMQGTTAWSAPGGQSGVDYLTAASASTFVSGVATYNWTGAGLVNDVQFMVDNSASNFGWFLISGSEGTSQTARRFGSSDGGRAATLEIDFTPVPEPSTLLFFGTFCLGWVNFRRRS